MGICCLTKRSEAQDQQSAQFPPGTREVYISDLPSIRPKALANIAPLVEKSIAAGNYPGAVILVSHKGNVIYEGVFGNQQVSPQVIPMKLTTIFDIASLTKVIVTTTSIMQLVESGRIDLDEPVALYWPEFAQNGKETVTVRELLTHTSGFQAVLPGWTLPQDKKQMYAAGIQAVEKSNLLNSPGTKFVYSDINFIVLGHLVELISGLSLDKYAEENIFKPLNMTSATFLPSADLKTKIAPTFSPEFNEVRWGQVNDPTAERLGGVSGVAGLFANAQDIGVFLECLLEGGRINYHDYLLSPLTILKMTTPQSPPGVPEVRGLGWDIDSSFSNRGVLLPLGSFGHTGWTGTSVWADPYTQTWIVVLTSRTHPRGPSPNKNKLVIDRRAIANIVASSLIDVNTKNLKTTGAWELNYSYTKFNVPAPTQ